MRKKTLQLNKFRTSLGVKNMRLLKIKCPACSAPAVIRKTSWKHPELADVYCACTRVECGKTWVSNLTYSHGLSPSGLTESNLVKELLARLRPEEKQMALNLLQSQV